MAGTCGFVCRTANTGEVEAMACNFVRLIDIAKIDQHGCCHGLPQTVEIKVAELIPFGDDDQTIRTFRSLVGSGGIIHIVKQRSCNFHSDGIECPDDRPLILKGPV